MYKDTNIASKNFKYEKKIILFFLFFQMFFVNLYSQENVESRNLLNKLLENGYENIRIKYEPEKIIMAYENRVYRFEVDAIKNIIQIISKELNNDIKIILIPENRKIPITKIETSVNDCLNYELKKISAKEFAEKLNIDFNVDSAWEEVKEKMEYNSSNTKFDLTIKPTFAAQFGVYTEPVMWQLNLVPGIRTSFWKGMLIKYELIFPIHNDLLPMEDSVRTGLAVVNQTFRLPNSFFLSTSIGYFSNNRYGFDFETRKFFSNGNFNIGFNFGFTSFAYFVGKRFYYSDQFQWTGAINLDYRVTEYNLTLGFSAGKFLMGDKSIRFDINREFREVEIGFFAIKSSDGLSNGGFNISIPLFPSKYWNPGVIRVRPEENISWGYVVRSNTTDLIGLRYNTGNRINTFIKKLNPEFIRNNFQ